MFTEKEGAIATLEERLAQAKKALEYCADGGEMQTDQLRTAFDALADIWPTPPKPRVIEVGGVYTLKTGSPHECVCVRGEFAYMLPVKDGQCPAYAWDVYGKSLSLNPAYDIDWSRS